MNRSLRKDSQEGSGRTGDLGLPPDSDTRIDTCRLSSGREWEAASRTGLCISRIPDNTEATGRPPDGGFPSLTSKERVEMIQKLLKYNIRAEIIKAEDGYSQENQAEFLKFFNPAVVKGTHPLERLLNKKMIASPGAWGYLKSYKKIILDAKRNDFHRILCLDDDVIFHHSFEQALNQTLQNIPEHWKLLYLGASQHDWNVPGHINYPEPVRQNDFPAHPYYFPVKTDGSFAVGIDSSVYDEILEEIGRMDGTLDSGPLRSIQQKYIGQCFVLNPNLVVADVSRSDTGAQRDQEIMAKSFAGIWANTIILSGKNWSA